ncbi:MAG: FAD-binding protein [Syntrophomonas sp.]|nr:FAD-binding protein [Syntrophomonas sp.]
MKVRIHGLRLGLDSQDSDLMNLAAQRLAIDVQNIDSIKLVKKAVDARRSTVYFICSVDVELARAVIISNEMLESPDLSLVEDKTIVSPIPGDNLLDHSPVVVGSGPAGLFCALLLARNGYRPVIIEQGQDMDSRIQQVDKFWQVGDLNERSNVQFGEGGAGTFSDGKLTTRIGDDRVDYVLKTFVEFGANEDIMYLKKPHLGTDAIRATVKRIRQEIIRLGGEFYFETCLTDINMNNGLLQSIIINNDEELPCSLLVLAIGNSARDVYRMLHRKGVRIIPKAFAVGLRIEHPQSVIDQIQYGNFAGHPRLPSADYHFTLQDRNTGRSLYTFCMCPGGSVIAASSAPGKLVINGMSYSERDSGIANSALVVTVSPVDWEDEVLGGIKYQEELEEKAFIMGGENYHAPAQYLQDFLDYKPSLSLEGSIASYAPGLTPSNLWNLLPRELAELMRRGIKAWNVRAPGFINDQAVMTGVETRTSAPVRIERDASLCSVNTPGLYPCGEGAGYAGGIMSAAVDGLKVAESIISHYRGPVTQVEIKKSQVVRGSAL